MNVQVPRVFYEVLKDPKPWRQGATWVYSTRLRLFPVWSLRAPPLQPLTEGPPSHYDLLVGWARLYTYLLAGSQQNLSNSLITAPRTGLRGWVHGPVLPIFRALPFLERERAE